jgi:hypothetical protein
VSGAIGIRRQLLPSCGVSHGNNQRALENRPCAICNRRVRSSLYIISNEFRTMAMRKEPHYRNEEGNLFQINSVALSPQANYTDRVTAICRRTLLPTFVEGGLSRDQRGGFPTAVNLSFLDRSRYFSFK